MELSRIEKEYDVGNFDKFFKNSNEHNGNESMRLPSFSFRTFGRESELESQSIDEKCFLPFAQLSQESR